MKLLDRGTSLTIWAPAKANLFLEILGKRADGYHELATLMVAVALFDELSFADDPSGSLHLECDRPDLSTGPDNLILRAARLLQSRTGRTRGARIQLVKRIPMMAGLAGGSSDAAAALIALDRLWQTKLSTDELAAMSAELGSDIPFFFRLPAAWCTGRGEKVEPIRLARALDLVLLLPSFGLGTAAVYKQVRIPRDPETGADIRQAMEAGDVELVGRRLFNRLEEAATSIEPRVDEYRRRLEQEGPAGARMSGSGSSLFAVCRDQDEARRIAQAIEPWAKEQQARVLVVRTGHVPEEQ
ncbi:MAG: 4-(cytidine 5'-diphospho)-2-C-methyl-D-erythritol kinase [Gemmataceae bacterium]|nr:4-(cytidine 5'-diphospho)-2-C-methyl-D-erythritol kinase [Gemmataceae bacterium]